jgi:ankyrin repeat protein
VVKALLNHGADPDAQDGFGWTALMKAADAGHEAVVEALLGADAKVGLSARDGATALFLAARSGHAALLPPLLRRGADPNEPRHEPLILASLEGHVEVVERLIKAGADVRARHSNGMTALQAATEGGHSAIVRLLRDAGARQ